MQKLTILTTSLFLLSGCFREQEPEPVVEKALFCDIEEPRKFSQEEINWRTENAPWNLRRDYRTNLSWDRECVPKV